ncbi:unnamed protein product [Linum tenue]|uniref:Growth-regulating factor n=1 Tax=Linum tenue TaxID=586396 RepID=A0AAV0K5N2_9ROSI|nr:unnamed protein product [Linum tenue]CAI0417382.1 unnamed protein product [Linum tenue]
MPHNHNSNNNKLRQILPCHHPSQSNNNNNSIAVAAAAAPPLKIPRLSSDYPATGLEGMLMWNMDPAAVAAHGSATTAGNQNLPSVGLGLGLTTGGGAGDDRQQQGEEEAVGKSMVHGFTLPQLQELQLQSVIYRYIEAGARVPPSLLVPIWRSLAAVPLHRRHHHHPTLHHLFPSCK